MHDGRRTFRGGSVGLVWFVTPHGLGHAARASAIMNACLRRRPGTRHDIISTVPREFFAESLSGADFGYHRATVDVGMKQRTAVDEDVPATVRALDRLHRETDLADVADRVQQTGCDAVVCDIAPLGLAVARRLGLPGVLVESFSWDWIYASYGSAQLTDHGRRLADWSRSADLVMQTEPCCCRRPEHPCLSPVSRRSKMSRIEVRRRLGITDDVRIILLSVGSWAKLVDGPSKFSAPANSVLVAPAGAGERRRICRDSVILADGLYHPDLVAAADVVIAKLGYSTVAEVFHNNGALAYLRRPRFPESPILEAFVRRHMPSAPLPPDALANPATSAILEKLLTVPRCPDPRPNGDVAAADLIFDFVGRHCRGAAAR